MLWNALWYAPARASLHYLRKNTVEDVPLHDAAIDNARDLIAAIREAQETLTFDRERRRTLPLLPLLPQPLPRRATSDSPLIHLLARYSDARIDSDRIVIVGFCQPQVTKLRRPPRTDS